MLNFNSEHKSINDSLQKSSNKAKIRNIIISGVLVTSIALFGGTLLSQINEVDCDINEVHAHHYVSDETFDKYMVSEKMYSGSWERTDEHIVIDEQMKELIDFENEEGLFRMSQNKDKINEITSSQEDYVEYRYQYLWQQPIPNYTIGANGTMQLHYKYVPHQQHSWTADSNQRELTGEERIVHHVYYGYKIVRNENGELTAI